MTKSKFDLKNSIAAVGVFFVRFLKLAPNFSPVGSFGFFSESPIYFIFTILLFDIVLGGFYRGFAWTYIGFASYYILGRIAKKNDKLKIILLPAASILFFLISNLGVYLNWYPQGTNYLIACYINALPFFKMTLLSDLFFGYGYLILKKVIENKLSLNSLRNYIQKLNFKNR